DAIEEFAKDKIIGIDLGEVEWYHRLRNQLYHQGNGLTVEREKVRIYAELAKLLFKNLFGEDLFSQQESGDTPLLGQFLNAWNDLEAATHEIWSQVTLTDEDRKHLWMTPLELTQRGIIKREIAEEISGLRQLRNGVVHGDRKALGSLKEHHIERV